MEYDRHEQMVRADLLCLPGSARCTVEGCTVITQGGTEGRRRHMEVVHGEPGR